MPNWCDNTVRILNRFPDPLFSSGRDALIKRIKSCVGKHQCVEGFFKDILEHDRELDHEDLGADDALNMVFINAGVNEDRVFILSYTSMWSPHLFGWAHVSAKYGVDIAIYFQREDQDDGGIALCRSDNLQVWQSLLHYTLELNGGGLEHCDEYSLKNDKFIIKPREGQAHA